MEENSNLLDNNNDYDDYSEELYNNNTLTEAPTEQEIRENPFRSLIEYNINHGGGINKFFDSSDYNQSDPFKAAANLSISFNQKMLGVEARTQREYLEFAVQVQADRLSSAIGSYEADMQRATGHNLAGERVETYKSPNGFLTRPTQYDTYSLFSNQEAREMGLRMSMYQLQETNTVVGISQRSRSSTEIVTQSFLNSDQSRRDLSSTNSQRSMRVLVGNEVASNILNRNENINVYGVGMPQGANLHAKVGYLYTNNSLETDYKDTLRNQKAQTAIISTQNITSALPKANTSEEMLVLSKGDIYRSNNQNPLTYRDSILDEREEIRNRLIDQLKGVTDAIASLAKSQQRQVEKSFRESVKQVTKDNITSLESMRAGANSSVFVNEDILIEIKNKVKDAAEKSSTKKVVLSIQYLENIFLDNSSNSSSRYDNDVRIPMLNALELLSKQGRLSLATSSVSFAPDQGLFNILDKFHSNEITGYSKTVLKTLLDNNSFSILPTSFAHSKTFAIFDMPESRPDLNKLKLDSFGISSANFTRNAFENNIETGLILDRDSLRGLTDREQQDITNYYYYGVSNFNRLRAQGSFVESRGNAEQTEKLIGILTSMGGQESRERVSGSPFVFSRRYDINRGVELSGLDIQIRGLGQGAKGYSFSVTVGQEYGQNGYEPIVYLSKNNRVINGMIYKNDSSQALQLYNGEYLAPGETRQFSALEVVGGLVDTLLHTTLFEASRGSLQTAIKSMTTATRLQGLSRVLGKLLFEQAQLKNYMSWLDSQGSGFTDVMTNLHQRDAGARGWLNNILNDGKDQNIATKTLASLAERLSIPLSQSSLGTEVASRLPERTAQILDILNKEIGGDRRDVATTTAGMVKALDRLLMNSLDNSQTATLYTDLLRMIVQQDAVANDIYERSQQRAKQELFSQMTSAFMQPHELRYSFGQALYKRPVFSINNDLSKLARSQNTLGLLLSPHGLRHGESLGDTYIRAIADSVRFTERDLYSNQGGIYKAEGGAVTIRHAESMLGTMRGIGILRRSEYRDRSLAAYIAVGLSDEQARRRTEEQEKEVFKLQELSGNSSSNLFFFPYRVTEQISGRLKNLQSGRPLEAASARFATYAHTLGVVGNDSYSDLSNMLSGNIFTSLPEHQYKYLQQLIIDHGSYENVLNYIRTNIHGDSLSLVRGLLGGSAPKRVLQSMGISTMSDFAYVNSEYKDADKNSLEYAYLHKTSMSFDTTQILSNVEFAGKVARTLTKGVTFLAKDTLIDNVSLNKHLQDKVLKDIAAIDSTITGSFKEQLQKLDKGQLKDLEKLVALKYNTVQFKASKGLFFFKKGVHSAAEGSSIEERLHSKRLIGEFQETKGTFTINGFYQYESMGGQEKAAKLISFKLPATSQRIYGGVTVLHEQPRVYFSGSSTLNLEMETSTIGRDSSGRRPGSDTNKGPNLYLAGDLFDFLDKYSGTNKNLLPDRVKDQKIYSVISPSQIKGFNFEQGLMLIEQRHGNRFLDLIDSDKGGRAVAEGLALMMLQSTDSNAVTISELLGQSLIDEGGDRKSVGYSFLMKPGGKAVGKKLPEKDNNPTISSALQGSFLLYDQFGSLALPEFLNSNMTISQALTKTVALALGTGNDSEKARLHLKNRSADIFRQVQRKSDKELGVLDPSRYIFSDGFDSRSASVLAYLVKAGQDLLGNVDTNARLSGNSISEVNPAYFMGTENRRRYLGEVAGEDSKPRRAMLASVRRVAAGLGVHLPAPEEINNANDAERGILERRLEYGLSQVNAMLRLNRFLEFGMEQLPSKVSVAVGMQNMTKLEGQYALELSQRELGLFTNTLQEKQDVLTIQKAVLLLGSLMEGHLPDPYKASKLYSLKVTNLASANEEAGFSKSLHFSTKFLSNFSRVAEKTLPTVVKGKRGFSTPLAEDAVLAYMFGADATNANNLVDKMGLVRSQVSGMVLPSAQDAEFGVDHRRRLLEQTILSELKIDPEQRKAIQNEVIGIIKDFEPTTRLKAIRGSNPGRQDFINRNLRNVIIERAERTLQKGEKLIAPVSYYEDFFYNLTRGLVDKEPAVLKEFSDPDTQKVATYLTDDLLRASGVYKHYQGELSERIRASQTTGTGLEYISYGLEVLRSVSSKFLSGTEPEKKKAQSLYDSITKTQRLVLPVLTGYGMKEGRYKVSYASTRTESPNQGLLLGLDLMQKLSLVFQGESHAALDTQVALVRQLDATKGILQKLRSGGKVELDDYELTQYRRLEFLMRESVETTAQLLNNQETIRQAGNDRLKLSGISAIAMSSLLLADDEVGFGSRFDEVTSTGDRSKFGLRGQIGRMHRELVSRANQVSNAQRELDNMSIQLAKKTGTGISGREVELLVGTEHMKMSSLINEWKDNQRKLKTVERLAASARQNKSLTNAEYVELAEFGTTFRQTGQGLVKQKSYVSTAILERLGLEYQETVIEDIKGKEHKVRTATSKTILMGGIDKYGREYSEYSNTLADVKTSVISDADIAQFESLVSKGLLKEAELLSKKIRVQEAHIQKLETKLREAPFILANKQSELELYLQDTATKLNNLKSAFLKEELKPNQLIAVTDLRPLISSDNRVDFSEFANEYILKLLMSDNTKATSKEYEKDRILREKLKTIPLFERLLAAKRRDAKASARANFNLIEGVYYNDATNVRQGSPSGASVPAGSGTRFVSIVPVETELAGRAGATKTFITPAQQQSSTVMLVAALGQHYTQLGDNDGDSFQGAVTQLASITRLIQQQQEKIQKLAASKKDYSHDVSLSDEQIEHFNNLNEKAVRAELAELEVHRDVLLKAYQEKKSNASAKAAEGMRRFTATYTAVPEEMMGPGGVLRDEQHQPLVKQYRDTLDGVYGNTKHAVDAIGNLNADVLSKLELTQSGTGFKVDNLTDLNLTQEQQDGVRAEIDWYNQQFGRDHQDQQSFKEAIIIQQATKANVNAAVSNVSNKQIPAALGSIVDDQRLTELQSILGASGSGLLGTTYNTVVPLVALKMGELTAQQTLKGEQGRFYRMSLAAGLTKEIAKVEKELVLDRQNKTLLAIKNELEAKRNTYFFSTESMATKLRLQEGKKQVEVAMRFVITTQQFLRDAGIKPKEDKSSAVKTTILEEADNFTLSGSDLEKYGIRVDEGETSVRGLTNIFNRLTGEDVAVRNNRENILTKFLGDKVGNNLDIYLDGEDRPDGDISNKQIRAFTALKLMTEYVSGRFEDTSSMIAGSVFSGVLSSLRTNKKYSSLSDDEFIPKLIANLTSSFQSEYILKNTIEIENQLSFASTGKEILNFYGIEADGSLNRTAIDSIVDKKRASLSGEDKYTGEELVKLEKYLKGYRDEQLDRQQAIAEATVRKGLTDDFKIFEAALATSINKTLEYDQQRLENQIVELKSLHSTLSQIREGGVPNDLEQNLNLYTTAFANQLGAGKIDSTMWSGFFAESLPEVARLAKEHGDGSESSYKAFFSLLGLEGTSIQGDLTDSNSKEVNNKVLAAAVSQGMTPADKLELAKEYTRFMGGNVDSTALQVELDSLDKEGRYLSKDAERVLLQQSGLSVEAAETFAAGIDTIRNLSETASAAEYAASQSAFNYTKADLNLQYTNLIAQQVETANNTDISLEERERLNVEYEATKNHIETQMLQAQQAVRTGEVVNSLKERRAVLNDTVNQLQASLNQTVEATIKKSQEDYVTKTTKELTRVNAASEAVSIFAIPILFALMQGKSSASEQVIQGVTDAAQAYLGSSFAPGHNLEKTAEKMREARIRSSLNMSGSSTASLLGATAFEAIFNASSVISNKAVQAISDKVGGFAATPGGRFAGELIGGVLGISLAGLVTNRKAGLPGEKTTEQDVADRIIEGIKQSAQAASARYSEMIIAKASVEVEGEDNASVESHLITSDYREDGHLSIMEKDELTGVTARTYEGDQIQTWMEG